MSSLQSLTSICRSVTRFERSCTDKENRHHPEETNASTRKDKDDVKDISAPVKSENTAPSLTANMDDDTNFGFSEELIFFYETHRLREDDVSSTSILPPPDEKSFAREGAINPMAQILFNQEMKKKFT